MGVFLYMECRMTQRLFLFDLDGTLVDSAPDLAGAMNEMLAARGLPERPLEELREPSGHGGPAPRAPPDLQRFTRTLSKCSTASLQPA